MNPTQTRGTAEGMAAAQRIADARARREGGRRLMRNGFPVENSQDRANRATTTTNLQPTVSANDLANPPAPVTPPAPQQGTGTLQSPALVGAVANQTQQFIQSQSEEAQKARELANLLGSQTFDGAGQREDLNQQFQIPQNLARLQDIQTQLAQANTQSALTQTRIEGAAGQTLGQAGREVTQEQRENAVLNAGLAAEAAVLTNQVETASTLVNQAMSDFYADRQLQNQNMIQQLQYFQSISDDQTAQLLAQEERKYQEDQARIEELKTATSNAMLNGASQSEVAFLTDPQTPDDVKLRVAQAITARGANELRNLEIQKSQAAIASSYASAASSRASAARANYELELLRQPPDPNALDADTLKTLEGLDAGTKTAIRDARSTVAQIDRMKELVQKNPDVALLTKATEDGREFQRLRSDVIDKLARQRTGAVVGAEEERQFKNILGIGAFDIMTKDKDELVRGLDEFKQVHNETLSLNDPTGRVQNYLDAKTLESDASQEIDVMWGVNTTSTINPANYYK